MKKLVFILRANAPANGLSIQTHRGSTVLVKKTEQAYMSLLDDEDMTDDELLAWYRKYENLGLQTRMIEGQLFDKVQEQVPVMTFADGTTIKKRAHAQPVETAADDTTQVTEKSEAEKSTAPKAPKLNTASLDTPSETEVVSAASADTAKPDPDTMTIEQLRAFVKEHDIKPLDRSKAGHISAIKNYLKSQG